MPNGQHGPRRPGNTPRRGGRGDETTTIRFEVPRRAAPTYITEILGDYHTRQSSEQAKDIPPGHRFLLWFHGMSAKGAVQCPGDDRNRKRQLRDAADNAAWDILRDHNPDVSPGDAWTPLKNQKRVALQAAAGMGKAAFDFLKAIADRQAALLGPDDWRRDAILIAPLATGLGNPHPVENGFAFLSPYGVPYLAGSGVKGVLRRAAEELALFEVESPWTLAHVWALFGFDENSSFFPKKDKPADPEWRQAYDDWCNQAARNGCAPLDEWVKAIRSQLPREQREIEPAALLTALPKDQKLRRAIHWQGMLAFADAFPDAKAQLAVDILNPHHKSYYEGKIENGRHATPHDAENPVPVFFLTVAPGARFTFAVCPLFGREAVWQHLGDWQALLDAAFDDAFDWLGFGAKTAVGYGAMELVSGTTGGAAPAPAQSKGGSWIEATIMELSARPGVKAEDVIRGKALAEAVRAIEDPSLRAEILEDIVNRWRERGWWDSPSGKSAKEAKKIYEEIQRARAEE